MKILIEAAQKSERSLPICEGGEAIYVQGDPIWHLCIEFDEKTGDGEVCFVQIAEDDKKSSIGHCCGHGKSEFHIYYADQYLTDKTPSVASIVKWKLNQLEHMWVGYNDVAIGDIAIHEGYSEAKELANAINPSMNHREVCERISNFYMDLDDIRRKSLKR